MQARIESPAVTVPGAIQALQRLSAAVRHTGIPESTLHLVEMRASQINGCAVCLDMHSREMKNAGEPDHRVATITAWREAPYFTDAERAALALTEAATRIADRSDPVPDDVWDEAARHYNEQQLGGLVLAITAINSWNRINVTTRQITGEWVDQWVNTEQAAS
jgi:AhpD family alkylhydroperoxidase